MENVMNFSKQKIINHLVCFSKYLIKYLEKLGGVTKSFGTFP